MKEINNIKDYQTIIQGEKPALIDFYADWCGPCQALLPTVELLAQQHADKINIVKVNVDKNKELAAHFGVKSIPALFFVKNGEITAQFNGVQSAQFLDEKISQFTEILHH
tara:strand:- start:116 stop:445 length:330 start_codon:yes stop_codon:yes gene_type:complete